MLFPHDKSSHVEVEPAVKVQSESTDVRNYQSFIEDKILSTPATGFDVNDEDIHPSLFPHQRDTVKWCAKGGRRAVFKSFGLGKTRDQLELMKLCLSTYEGPAVQRGLIVCPLGVRHEFKKEAVALGIEIEYVRNTADVVNTDCPYLITNYERVRDGSIDLGLFVFASLDEASVLRSYGSKTYQEFLPLFSSVPFRYVFTATPSPNRYKELIHYAGFLGVMDTGQALTRFFKRDPQKAGNLTLHPHKEKEFRLWVSTWALFLTKPSDLGYSDKGYDLPPLKVHYHRIDLKVDETMIDERDGQTKMYRDVAVDLRTASKEKRTSLEARVQKTAEIIGADSPDKHWIVWHHLEDERRELERAIPEMKAVYGSQDDDLKEKLLLEFGEGKYRIMGGKPEMIGSGGNYQRYCHAAIFMGINYKFNDFIQSLHRIQRFQQPHPVEIHILYTDSEENILKELQAKWTRHNELVKVMTDLIKEHNLSHSATNALKRSIGCERRQIKGKNFTYVNNDCVQELKEIESNRFGMILTSIPFSNHYEYTPSYLDFGHTKDDDHFFSQMDFLTPELLRCLKPGRVAAVHVKDRILFGNVTGYGMPSVNPFHMKTCFHYMNHGFIYMGMITIETDVVRENNQTYRLGWSEQCKDGSKMGVGSPEYLLLFRKLPSDNSRAYADEPVRKTKQDYSRGCWQIDARSKWNSSGNRLLTLEELAGYDLERVNRWFTDVMKDTVYDYDFHVRLAEALDRNGKLPSTFETLKLPARTEEVWHDIVRMRTLNSNQTQGREVNHICPFQLDVVKRAIIRWSNVGDEILDPFAGLASVGVEGLNLQRKFYGTELNPEYFRCGAGYLSDTEYKLSLPGLFDYLKPETVQ
jgi:DNA modification methylase